MASGIKSNGTDLDNIFAPYQTGQSKAASTGIESNGTDLNDRYAALSYGVSAGVTGIQTAGSDLNTIFAGSLNLTLYFFSTHSSTLATANNLSSTANATATSWTTIASGYSVSYLELYSQGNYPTGSPVTQGNSLPSPDGRGFLFDTTLLEGLQIEAGTFTPYITFIPTAYNVACTAFVRLYKRSSGGVYTQIVAAQAPFYTNNSGGNVVSGGWSNNTIASPVTFATGDKVYADIIMYCPSGFDPSFGGAGLDWELGEDSFSTPGPSIRYIKTPGFG